MERREARWSFFCCPLLNRFAVACGQARHRMLCLTSPLANNNACSLRLRGEKEQNAAQVQPDGARRINSADKKKTAAAIFASLFVFFFRQSQRPIDVQLLDLVHGRREGRLRGQRVRREARHRAKGMECEKKKEKKVREARERARFFSHKLSIKTSKACFAALASSPWPLRHARTPGRPSHTQTAGESAKWCVDSLQRESRSIRR